MWHKQEASFVFPPAHERFIPNFALAQAIFKAYLTQYALPGVYITGTVERY